MRVLILEDDHWIADLLKQIVLSLRPHADIVCLEFSSPFAIAIKARWQLPMALRDLIGACYALPNNSVKRAAVLMRLAACELAPAPDSNDQARLRRLAGLT
jgi:hypothetical protein